MTLHRNMWSKNNTLQQYKPYLLRCKLNSIVHVMGISRPECMSLEAVFGDHFASHTERREFVYRSNASHFLFGDLTGHYVEKEALQLLAGLLQFRRSSEGVGVLKISDLYVSTSHRRATSTYIT